MRGSKTCSKCGCVTGPRSYYCPKCSTPFVIKGMTITDLTNQAAIDAQTLRKRKKIHHVPVNFRDLVHGDIIRVISGGPIWKYVDGVEEPMGYHGIFRVKSIDHEGIHAYPIKAHESGQCYIFCGASRELPSGTILYPHKIVRVKQKVKTENVN